MGRGSSKAGRAGGGGFTKSSKGDGGASVSKAYSDIMNNSATINSLANLKSQMDIDKAKFNATGHSVKMQNATIKNGNQTINITFYSDYEPTQVAKPTKAISTKIEARLWENGNIKALRTIDKTSTKSLKNAKTQYETMLDTWKRITGQKAE